jgi:hypothetical protein
MSHIEDQSKRPGRGGRRRWRARYIDSNGRERSKSFDRRVDAEQFLAIREKARVRAELLASDGDGIDPAGYYVYLLWAIEGDAKPVYIGQSGNILARLGSHLGDPSKRAGVGWITLIRCTSQQAMMRREAELIRKYRPAWNRHVPGATAAGPAPPGPAATADDSHPAQEARHVQGNASAA